MKGFLYETHLHTRESSACGKVGGSELALFYKKLGYEGIIVTDHFFNGNTSVSKSGSWNKRVDLFCIGYDNAKKTGDRIQLQVFFGWESSYDGVDFLIYGLDKKWLYGHPECETCTIEEQYKMVHEAGGMIVQAHPYREAAYIPEPHPYPEFIDAVEGINAANDKYNVEYNKKAMELAAKHHLPMTAGSDLHSNHDPYTYMIFDERLQDIHDYCAKVRQGTGYHLNEK